MGYLFNDTFIANFQEIVKVKKIENRSVFDEVMPKILLVPFFPGHGVYFSIRGCCALKFLHALQIDQALLAHTRTCKLWETGDAIM